MKHLGLFEGIGGFSLAARWMGWETVAWVEIDKFCQKVLNKNFPESKGYEDIKTFEGTSYRETVDIITGGFPCQPYSIAGKRKGNKDDRHLWPEMLRVIREIQPRWVVGENVCGLVNWQGGLVFEEVQTDLENQGYEVQSFILPACSVNAPHRRDRVWIVAHAHRDGQFSRVWANEIDTDKKRFNAQRNIEQGYTHGITANSNSTGLQEQHIAEKSNRKEFNTGTFTNAWDNWPTQPPVCVGNDGLSSRLDRLAIKAAGNAIVPQVAYEIFKAIQLHENTDQTQKAN